MDKINKDNVYDAYDNHDKLYKMYIEERLTVQEVLEKLDKFIREKDRLAVEKFNNMPCALSTVVEKGYLKGKVEAFREVYDFIGIINSFR